MTPGDASKYHAEQIARLERALGYSSLDELRNEPCTLLMCRVNGHHVCGEPDRIEHVGAAWSPAQVCRSKP